MNDLQINYFFIIMIFDISYVGYEKYALFVLFKIVLFITGQKVWNLYSIIFEDLPLYLLYYTLTR